MALEQTEIVNELKAQGINESLGNGLSFETTEDLSSWVSAYKTSLPPKAKEIQDYTKEEIEAIAKDKPDADVRNIIKHHLRRAGMKNTHLL